MVGFDSVEGLDALPRRIFLEGEREPIPDQDGFILPIGTVLTPKHLLQEAAVLAVAPPWTGKTTVAEGISRVLKPHPFSALTCFEERERGAPFEPDWWERWKESAAPAYWIVDAVDEDDRKDRQCVGILRLLRDLPDEFRARLHFIAFCRINEIPEWFEKRLEEIYGGRLRRLRLAGLDRESARLHVGHGRFDRICQLIRDNDLQSLAPFPAVLRYLAEREEGGSLTKDKVWEGILTDLLREKRDNLLHPSFRSGCRRSLQGRPAPRRFGNILRAWRRQTRHRAGNRVSADSAWVRRDADRRAGDLENFALRAV